MEIFRENKTNITEKFSFETFSSDKRLAKWHWLIKVSFTP
jgi:hypothetical protein